MIHRRSPRCVDNLTAEATHVPARAGGYGPIGGGFIKGFSSRHSQSAPRLAWRIWRIPGVKSRSATKPSGRLDSYRCEEEGHVPSDYVGRRAPARQVLAVIARGRNDIARARRLSLDAYRGRADSARRFGQRIADKIGIPDGRAPARILESRRDRELHMGQALAQIHGTPKSSGADFSLNPWLRPRTRLAPDPPQLRGHHAGEARRVKSPDDRERHAQPDSRWVDGHVFLIHEGRGE